MGNNETGLNILTSTIETVITGVPAPVRKNFIKAFGQLCTAAVDIPVAWLEGKSAEIRTTTEARLQIIRKEGDVISEQIEVPKEYISKASSKFASKIIKEQLNLDQITLNAANELAKNTQIGSDEKEAEDISEDWLNEFENLARLKSSEDMKLVFGKILSGEIIKPGSFSIKTIKLISQLDNEAAKLFQIFCNQAISLRVGGDIFDARVVSFDGSPTSNSLKQFDLSFSALNVLQEYGLIITDYNSCMNYSSCIANDNKEVVATLQFQNKNYGFVPSDKEKYDKEAKLNGVALTKAGQELLDIIPIITNSNNYKDELIKHFESKHLNLAEVK
jgi:hypothetical protein